MNNQTENNFEMNPKVDFPGLLYREINFKHGFLTWVVSGPQGGQIKGSCPRLDKSGIFDWKTKEDLEDFNLQKVSWFPEEKGPFPCWAVELANGEGLLAERNCSKCETLVHQRILSERVQASFIEKGEYANPSLGRIFFNEEDLTEVILCSRCRRARFETLDELDREGILWTHIFPTGLTFYREGAYGYAPFDLKILRDLEAFRQSITWLTDIADFVFLLRRSKVWTPNEWLSSGPNTFIAPVPPS